MQLGSNYRYKQGGLAFRYTGSEQLPNASFDLGISSANVGFDLGKVPFKAIWDFEIANEVAYSFTTIRRCGVEFGKLTPQPDIPDRVFHRGLRPRRGPSPTYEVSLYSILKEKAEAGSEMALNVHILYVGYLIQS